MPFTSEENYLGKLNFFLSAKKLPGHIIFRHFERKFAQSIFVDNCFNGPAWQKPSQGLKEKATRPRVPFLIMEKVCACMSFILQLGEVEGQLIWNP